MRIRTPAEGADVQSVDVEINSYESVTVSTSETAYAANRVVMYATSWCPYCRKAREYFEANGIPFTEYHIERNDDARREYDALGATGVPVILVGNKRMNGLSVEGFQRLYR